MQTEVGYIQEKDYLPKPSPFYHKPKPILVGDVYKLDWEEDAGLKSKYELEQKVLEVNTEWELIPKPFRNQFGVHYNDIRELLSNNQPNEAIEYLTALYVIIPEPHHALLAGIIDKINTVYEYEYE